MEDDRFEADILLETNRRCVGRLQALFDELEREPEPVTMKKEALSAVEWRAIRRLYADKGVDEVIVKAGMKRGMNR